MTLALLTPSYGPDFESFRLLHRSVLEFTDPDVIHHVIVPDADLPLFRGLGSSRLRLIGERELLPRRFVSTGWFARAVSRIPHAPRGARFVAVNARVPWPPLRSWMLQQILKLTIAGRIDTDVLVLIDSDVQLVAPLIASRFQDGSAVRLYRNPDAISEGMTRHVTWHRTARRLLGLPDDGPPPYDDPIAGMVPWDPAVVRGLLARLEEVGGRPWQDMISREWEFSEYVLYGQYREHLADPGRRRGVTDRTGCLSWWDPVPMTDADARELLAVREPGDIALLIQSTSRTPADVREWLAREMRQALN